MQLGAYQDNAQSTQRTNNSSSRDQEYRIYRNRDRHFGAQVAIERYVVKDESEEFDGETPLIGAFLIYD